MSISKDEYIRRSLRKIAHKEWELYVISRIIHKLDDAEIEFVTQQVVRLKNNWLAFTDLYFPQFGIHLEIDEPHHRHEMAKARDASRTREIVRVTSGKVHRIEVYEKKRKLKPLSLVNQEVDGFVAELQDRKRQEINKGTFVPWDYESQFNPDRYIKKGSLSIQDLAIFRTQVDALRCLGYRKGLLRKGSWAVPNLEDTCVWFPRLYDSGVWSNSLTSDGSLILERLKKENKSTYIERLNGDHHVRIVFAHEVDPISKRLYRFKGVFRRNLRRSRLARGIAYERVGGAISVPDGALIQL